MRRVSDRLTHRRGAFWRFPPSQYPKYCPFHFCSRLLPLQAARQKRIVIRLRVPNVSNHGQPDCLLVETLGGCRAPYAATILLTGVLRDDGFSSCRAVWEKLAHARRKATHKSLVQLGPAGRFTLASPCPDLAVGQTFLLGLFYRLFFDQQSLTFIPLASAAPFQHDG
jgi:hypothetical protein